MSGVSTESRRQANLRLLQKTCDRNIVDILHSATHVVLYEFRDGAWFKGDNEGSCFLCYTRDQYLLIILNRNSADNFSMTLDPGLQMQHQAPYLIFKQASDKKIRGVWFHNDDERELMQIAIQASLDRLQQGVGTPAATSTSSATPSVDTAAALSALLSPLQINPSLPPAAPAVASPPPAATINTPGVALDKKSLQLALLSLIQDDRFLDLLHSQYLKVVHTRAKKGRSPQT